MINRLLQWFVRSLLFLRYRVRVTGLEAVAERGTRGILFLPNHPAMIDPFIVMTRLYDPFRARALADQKQIDRFFIRWLAKRARVMPLADLAKAGGSAEGARAAIDQCVDALRNGDNLILYPGGQVVHERFEDLRSNSGVRMILDALPDVRVVLIRTRGLWGSIFSWASGRAPGVGKALRLAVRTFLASGIFFARRREVTMELVEPEDLPRQADRNDLNRYLEAFYNDGAPPNTYVPRTFWERGEPQILPEPATVGAQGDLSSVSATVRTHVHEFVSELTGVTDPADEARLAHDLGMDSLDLMDVVTFLQTEFGSSVGSLRTLQTVGDIMLLASGRAISTATQPLSEAPRQWFKHLPSESLPPGLADMTIPQAFLTQAQANPNAAAVADQLSGVKTYRQIAMGVNVLAEHIEPMPGENIGIMLPASIAAGTLFMATLFAGKTPAMINWTLGPKNLAHCVEVAGIQAILTSRALVERLENQGVAFGDIRGHFVFLEDIAHGVTRGQKIRAFLAARFAWTPLRRRAEQASKDAVILFTSGSESVPKAVPLTHRNILTNVADIYQCFTIKHGDCLLGILPPFHSFGLTTSVILPLSLGLRVAYSPDPTEGATLAATIETYRATMLVGTPTFLEGIIRASQGEELETLRLVVSGAETCPPRVYDLLQQQCPQTIVLEGYGATECSPVIAVNHEDDVRPYTIGRPLRSVERLLVDPDSGAPVGPGQRGLLLARGPSVFDGYLNHPGESPFVTVDGKSWYRTGDLVTEQADGSLSFAGRLKRFIKLGGEMISLPAIEAVLAEHFTGDDDEGPILAVTATTETDNPEIVLFTPQPIERQQANQVIREAGLSGLHNIRRVLHVEYLPHLGTGKIDYRALNRILSRESET
jgi:long-chain-fatty-acid--[acyl-carrier-protein] ligase